MIRRLFNACLCRPEDLRPSREDLKVIGVFNPGAALVGDEVVLLVRVAEQPREQRPGRLGLPRWEQDGLVVDWVDEAAWRPLDARVVQHRESGLVRLNFVSHLRVLRCGSGREVTGDTGVRFEPQGESETFGVEDPRITRIDDRWWFTYVAVSPHGPATALASTRDFRSFTRHGIIFPVENKDVVLFPERIGGEFKAIHRPMCATPFTPPEMWLAGSPDLHHWGRHQPMLGSVSSWDAGRVGAGTPPLRVEDGWLEIYHGSARPVAGGVGVYSAAALLLHPEEPHRILRRSAEPILLPEAPFEREGFVPNVVFPTGLIDRGETLLIYYGAADTACGVVEFEKKQILAAVE
ncbi:MAG TPA: glycoside hydrolase family 130 protein [Phycisphaerae bacterium]|jgi:predicted GH43/DUF377 family glycosyl hydrolase|nr:glycosylase [Phycisphaerae bacterium]HOB74490.1 glycoside hydrolase family 130 protein [Phycisphaerae bacterium]HOJ56799.1 glycoside hydrolase family 130 protein [Phycisphaerae bacterium]HOL28549.1 glycoside hydrolase family 130 protein [Phycisphaerae bacterium]HPP23065.1 glycoside hydrolase family 130 protein [Phycisphaerae bacterium]